MTGSMPTTLVESIHRLLDSLRNPKFNGVRCRPQHLRNLGPIIIAKFPQYKVSDIPTLWHWADTEPQSTQLGSPQPLQAVFKAFLAPGTPRRSCANFPQRKLKVITHDQNIFVFTFICQRLWDRYVIFRRESRLKNQDLDSDMGEISGCAETAIFEVALSEPQQSLTQMVKASFLPKEE